MFESMIGAAGAKSPASMLPGLVAGTVKENYDKNQPGKVKVEYSLGEQGKVLSGWVPVMTPYVAEKGGMYLLPETGSQVVIGFLGGRFDCPVVLGSLWSSQVERPEKAVTEKNTEKIFRTKGGHEIRLSEEKKKEAITITTPGELTIFLSDEKKLIAIRDKDKKNTFSIDASKGEISVKADKKLSLTVGSTAIALEKNKLTLQSGTVEGNASQTLKLKGQSSSLEGTQVQVKADGSLKVQSGGIAEVKGSMVKIN